jgi:ribosomal protein S18 acetylase RimI-like enzyme
MLAVRTRAARQRQGGGAGNREAKRGKFGSDAEAVAPPLAASHDRFDNTANPESPRLQSRKEPVMTSVDQFELLDNARFAQARTTLSEAFFDYPLMVYAMQHEGRRTAAVNLLYGAILWDSLRWGEVHITPAVDAVCAWLPPENSNPTFWRQARAGMLKLPLRFGLTGFRKLTAYDDMAGKLHHDHAPMPHYYLSAIGVAPGRQGQGLGSVLMQPMLGRADDQQLHCWLDTHREENVRLYERHGFQVARLTEVAGHPVPVWGMLRKPR